MENDCLYSIGCGHRVCQDYAHSSNRIAIVSDGCSASASSDLGSRYLCGAAALRDQLYPSHFDANWVIRRAAIAAAMLGQATSVLDATLLFAKADTSGGIKCHIAGDGIVAVKSRAGDTRVWQVDDGPAPAYLSYTLQPERLQRYWKQWGGLRRITQWKNGCIENKFTTLLQESYVFTLSFQQRDVESIFLLSDGFQSFSDNEGSGVSMNSIIDEVCAIRSYRGSFVTRRVGRFLKKTCSEHLWTHQDDIAIAALHFPEGDHEHMD